MRIDCLIVEDEPLALERVRGYVARLPYLNLVGAFDNALDALLFLKGQPVDLLFLDINLGELSGIQLLETARITAEVIITTAYDEYALKGYELNVADYLLKPFPFERFLMAVERVLDALSKKEAAPEKSYLFIKTEYRLEKLFLHEILYIEGMRDYRRIYTQAKRLMTLQTFGHFEQELPPARFCRVHKSYMVALDKIETIERDRIKLQEALIPISETYRKAFFARIQATG